MSLKSPGKPLVFSVLILTQILFASNIIVSKIVLVSIPPLAWAALRVLGAAFFMLLVAILSRQPRPALDRKYAAALFFLAVVGVALAQGALTLGLSHTTAINSSILITLVPIICLLIVTVLKIDPLTPVKTVGFMIAFGGVLSLLKVENFTFANETLMGDLITTVGVTSYSLFLVFGKKFLGENNLVWTMALGLLIGGTIIALGAITELTRLTIPTFTGALVALIIYSILGGIVIAYFLNIWGLSHMNSSVVALLTYLQPPIVAILAFCLFGQVITLRALISFLFIFLGMIMAANSSKPKVAGV